MQRSAIFLKKGKEEPIKRFHLWVFSGAIARIDGQPKEGEVVDVYSFDKKMVGLWTLSR